MELQNHDTGKDLGSTASNTGDILRKATVSQRDCFPDGSRNDRGGEKDPGNGRAAWLEGSLPQAKAHLCLDQLLPLGGLQVGAVTKGLSAKMAKLLMSRGLPGQARAQPESTR